VSHNGNRGTDTKNACRKENGGGDQMCLFTARVSRWYKNSPRGRQGGKKITAKGRSRGSDYSGVFRRKGDADGRPKTSDEEEGHKKGGRGG